MAAAATRYDNFVHSCLPGEGGVKHELNLTGLKQPLEFKRAVWAMKRGDSVPHLNIPADVISAQPTSVRTTKAASLQDNGATTQLLTEIRDELRTLNLNATMATK